MTSTELLNDKLFLQLVEAASMAPSSDNMQPWEFRKEGDAVHVYCVEDRLLRIDVENMFSWISIGAAIQNMIERAAPAGLQWKIDYQWEGDFDLPVAIVEFRRGRVEESLADQVESRTTNRNPFVKKRIDGDALAALEQSAAETETGICWMTSPADLKKLASVDALFSAILLEHKPLFDGLFDTIRFSKREMETLRCGMDIKSLDMPFLFAFIAGRLKRLELNRVISRLGIGPVVAGILSSRLKKAGALCLLSIEGLSPLHLMEAGRAMEKIWLKATAMGLSVHPYGVVPQYFAMAECNPVTFLPAHVQKIDSQRKIFSSLFPRREKTRPAIMLRIGYSIKKPLRTTIRFKPEQIIQNKRGMT